MLYSVSTEFQVWKEEYEKENDCWFIKDTGKKATGLYFYCNRSGYFHSKSKGKRHLKSQGTSKINTYCTAALTVRVHSDITSMFVHTVVILVRAHCGITSMCVCTQW